MLPWLLLPKEESSENDVLLDSSVVSLLLAFNSRMENKQVGVGKLLRMRALFQGEGQVIVKISRDRNVRWDMVTSICIMQMARAGLWRRQDG